MADGIDGGGPLGGVTNRPKIDGGTLNQSATIAPSFRYTEGKGVSYELRHAPAMCVMTSLSTLTEDEMQVLAWLVVNRAAIVAAAARFKVDRRAIAGAIAWEALENSVGFVKGSSRKASGINVGPGKLHMLEIKWRFVPYNAPMMYPTLEDGNGLTWPKGVEDAGLMPAQTFGDRCAVAETDEGAIQYVAAAMSLIATIYESAGSPGVCNPSIRHNPVLLTNVYNSKGPATWEARVKVIKPGETLVYGTPGFGNLMDIWVAGHMQYLEDGVGAP